MCKAKIKLVYKQEIDEKSVSAFEKAIFHASYQEFMLKSQAYNRDGKLKTFSKMKANDGRANSLHYKLSFAVLHFISQLNNQIPVIKDNLGNKLKFEIPHFELIESHTEDISLHKVAISYETGFLTLVAFMGEYLLLTNGNAPENEMAETFVIQIQQGLSIKNYQEHRTLKQSWLSHRNLIPLFNYINRRLYRNIQALFFARKSTVFRVSKSKITVQLIPITFFK